MSHWSKVFKLSTISLRLFNVYGLRSRTTGAYGAMFGVFLAQKINNKPLTIVGNGKQSRDFTYVTDVTNAFYLAAKCKIFHDIFNVGTGKPTSVNYIATKLGGKKVFILRIFSHYLLYMITTYHYDLSMRKQVLGS